MDHSLGVLERGLTEDKANHLEASLVVLGRQDEVPFGVDSKSPLLSQHERDASPRRSMPPIRWIIWVCLLVLLLVLDPLHLIDSAPLITGHKVCNWPGISNYSGWSWHHDPLRDVKDAVTEPEDLSQDPRVMHEVPQYVIDYAPLVHLFSGEQFWPCDIAEHLFHVTPELNYTPVQGRLQSSKLTNLDRLNQFEDGRYVYLTSNDNVEDRPEWLGGEKNIPDEFDYDGDDDNEDVTRIETKAMLRKRNGGGRSNAPAVLVVVNKGKGIVDAFWFFFYSYNLGNKVFNIRWGNHVGDWEHTLIRFQHGEPKLLFFSEHNFGEAYSYGAVEKIGRRVSSINPNLEKPPLTLRSLLSTLRLAPMQCMAHRASILTSSLSASSTIRPIVDRYGTLLSTLIPIPIITLLIRYVHQTLRLRLQLNGSTSLGSGATKLTLRTMIDNTALMGCTITLADLLVLASNILADGKCARGVMLTPALSNTGWVRTRSRCGLAWMKEKGRRIYIRYLLYVEINDLY